MIPVIFNSNRIRLRPTIGGLRHSRPSARKPGRAASFILAILNTAPLGIKLARLDQRLIVHVFERDWRAVDRLREAIRIDGLADRVSVRVIDALAFVNLKDYDLVLADCEHSGLVLQARDCR
jgi:hypothetical protein